MFPFIRSLLRSRVLLVLASLYLAYLLLGYWAVNPVAQRVFPWVAEQQLDSHIRVERVSFDPLALTATLDQLQLTRRDGAPLAAFERLHFDLELSGLWKWAWHLKELRLTDPQLSLDIAPDGTLNWAELIAKLNESASPPSDQLVRLVIDHIQIERGRLHYQDRARPVAYETVISPLTLELDGLSTLPSARGRYQLEAKLPLQGGVFKWQGDIGLNPVVSRGSLDIQGIQLAKLMQLTGMGGAPLQLDHGTIASRFDYRFALIEHQPRAVVSDLHIHLTRLKGALTAAELSLTEMKAHLPQMDIALSQGQPEVSFKGLDIGLQQLALHQEGRPLLLVPQVQLQQLDFDLGTRRLDIAALTFTEGSVHVRRDAQGALDWLALTAPSAGPSAAPAVQDMKASPGAPAPWVVTVNSFRFDNWRARYQDMRFADPVTADASGIAWDGRASHSSGSTRIELSPGTLGETQLSVSRKPQPLATMAGARLPGGLIDVGSQTLKLDALVISGLHTAVVRAPDRTLNWQQALAPASPAPQPDSTPTKARPTEQDANGWKLSLDRIALEDAQLRLKDDSTAAPVMLDIEAAALELREASLDLAHPMPIRADFSIAQGGHFNTDGKLTLAPFNAELQVKLTDLALTPFAPYLNQATRLDLERGKASVFGTLSWPKAQTPRFNGGFRVDALAIVEENTDIPFLSWETLSSDSLDFDMAANRLHIADLRLAGAASKFIIHEDGSVNTNRIIKTGEGRAHAVAAPRHSAPEQSDTAKPFQVAVERLWIDSGQVAFADLSLTPQFGADIHSLSGVINGLSSQADSLAQVELDGRVDNYGSVRVRGSLQPLRASEQTDLTLAFSNLEMNRLTPYSGKFAGRRIEAGKLSATLQYKVKARQLSGKNSFVINKLRLGERVESRDAVDLPLDLAIALLEDSEGVIDLDLPVSGHLDNPEFSYSAIVWKALTGVMGKLVTAPFRALGKLLGIGAEKLESVVFDPGNATLSPPEQEKLQALVDGMSKRPALSIAIAPAYSPEADRAALQEAALRRDVAQQMALTLVESTPAGPIDLANEKVRVALMQLAADRLPAASIETARTVSAGAEMPEREVAALLLGQLRHAVKIDAAALQQLATQRAASVRQYLLLQGMAEHRIQVTDIVQHASAEQQVALKMQLGTGKGPARPADSAQ